MIYDFSDLKSVLLGLCLVCLTPDLTGSLKTSYEFFSDKNIFWTIIFRSFIQQMVTLIFFLAIEYISLGDNAAIGSTSAGVTLSFRIRFFVIKFKKKTDRLIDSNSV